MIAKNPAFNEDLFSPDHYQVNSIRLRRYLKRLGLQGADAEDVAQEVWLRIWKKQTDFDGTNFRGWMLRIARNCVVDLARKKETQQRSFERLQRNTSNARRNWLVGSKESRRKSSNEQLDKVRKLILNSKNSHLRAVQSHLDGESAKQTAERLGVSENTVYSRRHRGRAIIREMLNRGET